MTTSTGYTGRFMSSNRSKAAIASSFCLLGLIHFARVFDSLLSLWGIATAVDYLRLYSSPFIGAFILLIILVIAHFQMIRDSQIADDIRRF
jgi:hypothetical protein